MIFTGYNKLILPELNEIKFSFENLYLFNTGNCSISFSGASEIFGIKFSANKTYLTISGEKIYRISNYNLDEIINISGALLSDNSFDLFYNESHRNIKNKFINNDIKFLIINLENNNELKMDINLFSTNNNLYFDTPNNILAFQETGIKTNSEKTFWFLNSSSFFKNSYQTLLSIDPIIAKVTSGKDFYITLKDIDDSYQNYELDFETNISSALGSFIINTGIIRTGVLDDSYVSLENLNDFNNISGEFDGIWENNQFVYSGRPQYLTLNYALNKINGSGDFINNQNITIKYETIYPENGSYYQSEYITGFTLTNTGEYTQIPSVNFTGYYYITGIQQSLSNLLFNTGCSGNILLTFSGGNGSGASGYLLTYPVTLSNIYISGNNKYKIITGLQMINLGSNYTTEPIAIINTGLFSNCYDVPLYNGYNYSIFSSFNTSASLSPQASYLTGEVLYQTGLVGTGVFGYIVTGLDITNLGSGYNNTNLPPLLSFIRQDNDLISGNNASGILKLKDSGLYDFNSLWFIETGLSNNDLSPLSGYSGTLIIPNNNQYFSVLIYNTGIDNTQDIISRLSLTLEDGTEIQEYITGYKYYNTDPYYLKKKINLSETIIISGNDLSFLLTQDELDSYYSGPDFISSQTLDLGDLTF